MDTAEARMPITVKQAWPIVRQLFGLPDTPRVCRCEIVLDARERICKAVVTHYPQLGSLEAITERFHVVKVENTGEANEGEIGG